MRSYQYYAAIGIADTVAKKNWEDNNQLGGHVWHTTGSGKTMTSFKSAQLIASSHDADKVVFLVDRKELGMPYHYAYTANIPNDIHIQKSELPDGIKEMLGDFQNHTAELLNFGLDENTENDMER